VRVTLIHNPGAGDEEQPDAEALQAFVRACGHDVRYQPVDGDTWSAVLDEPADVVAVAGGDGTLGRVAKKLIGRNTPLAPLPLGTANNICRTLAITDVPLEELVAGWTSARRVHFDVGVANGPWGSRYFVEGSGLGLFACAIPDAERSRALASLTDAEDRIAHALQILRERLAECPPHPIELRLDGRDMSGEYVMLEAMNMAFVGPNLYLAPSILPDDGLLDVVLVDARARDELYRSLASWQEGELRHPQLTRHRASRVELSWTGYEVHIDDEPWPQGERGMPPPAAIELTIERDALEFLAPHAALRRSRTA
jgi:diacylglycerol kinase (ATP)